MRILIWTDSYPPCDGGIERMTSTLAEQLASRGHQVAVVTSDLHLPLSDVKNADDIQVVRFDFLNALATNNLKAVATTLRGVAALKQEFRPDIVHLHLQAASSFFHLQTMQAWNCPTVLTVHGEFGDCKAGPETILGRLFERADWISAVSQAMLDDTRTLIPSSGGKSCLIYNGIDTDGFENQLAPSTPKKLEAPVVFAYGRLVREKGFDLLLTAFHQMLPEMPQARLVVAGDGTERDSLQNMILELGMAHAVSLPGRLSDEALHAEMAKATVLVIPSRWREGFGLVALEGALLELPIIATSVGGLPEVIEHMRTGILVMPEDPIALKDAMLQLLRNPDQCRKLGEAARADVQQRFNLSNMIDKYESMYRKVCEPQPPATVFAASVPGSGKDEL